MSAKVVRLLLLAIAVSPAWLAAAGVPGRRQPVQQAGKALEATITPRASRSSAVDFANDVGPLLIRLGCAQSRCHGSMSGKGGLKLSLFGAETDVDCDALTRSNGGRRVNKVEPRRSLMLLKATAALPHGGGQLFAAGSYEYNILVSWIAQGAVLNNPDRPRLQSLKATPEELTLALGETQPILVSAVFTAGKKRDVTRYAAFRVTPEGSATVDSEGRVTAKKSGQCTIVATYMRQPSVTQVYIPQTGAKFADLKPAGKIDELCLAKLKQLGVPPSPVCSDEVFLRRVYLDTIGLLPTPAEAKAFLGDRSGDKRAKLVDQLLARPEYADHWANKWGDLLRIKSEYPVKLWPKAVSCYYRWLHDAITADKPYDQFVRELLTSTGSNFKVGPANFMRAVANKDPQTLGETASLLFMGARLSCARCHGHPYENWSLEDDLATGAFFGKVRYKATQEWKEEVVYIDPDGTFRNPRTRQVVAPKFLGGDEPTIDKKADPRLEFARWLTTPDNPWFAPNVVNRIWFWLLGRGIVHEADDLRPTNPPVNPELLDYLVKELVTNGFHLKPLYRLILTSQTYQLSSRTTAANRDDVALFSHYPVKRLTAEQLLDAIDQVTGTTETFWSLIPEPYTYLPRDFRAVQLADGSIETPFLNLFGRPPRDTPYESDRCSRVSMRQAMFLLSSADMEGKVNSGKRIKQLLEPGRRDGDVVEEIYLAALSRRPSETEQQAALAHIGRDPQARAAAVQDVLWAVLNTKEFEFNH